jgi:gluconate 5-dehydrogenase
MGSMARTVQQLTGLSGRVALITGGSRGLGKQMAEGLAEAGASLFLLARRAQWLVPTIEEFSARGWACAGIECDVANPDQAARAVERTVQRFGRIDILINSAGVAWGAPAEEMPLDKWRTVVDVNLTGAFLFCQEAGRHMIRQKSGSIINIASINALMGGLPMRDISNAAYVASKGGLVSLTRELASKWGPHGVRVNGIAPGYFPTRMTEKIWDQAQQAMRDIPLGRGGGDDELKGVAVFLASEASSYITGQTIVVDGGATLI